MTRCALKLLMALHVLGSGETRKEHVSGFLGADSRETSRKESSGMQTADSSFVTAFVTTKAGRRTESFSTQP